MAALDHTRTPLIILVGMLLLVVAGSGLAQSSGTQAKTALLIANSDYTTFGNLANPVPEARQFASSLRSIGFDVTIVENVSREEMLDALYDFEARVRSRGGVALVHYGGHGVQVDGENYLIPANADIPDERRVATRAVSVREIMATLDASDSDTNIVVLDACRNNPLPESSTRSAARGLGLVAFKPRNSLLVYAAQPGEVAQDGLFTPSLARRITDPGVTITEVLQEVRREVYEASGGVQLPGSYDELLTPVYLAGMGTTAAVADSRPTVQVERATGDLLVTTEVAGTLWLDGVEIGLVGVGEELMLRNVVVGLREIEVRGDETVSAVASVARDQAVSVRLHSRFDEAGDGGAARAQATAEQTVGTNPTPEGASPAATGQDSSVERGTALAFAVGSISELVTFDASLSWYESDAFAWGVFAGFPSAGLQATFGDTGSFAFTTRVGFVWLEPSLLVGARLDVVGFLVGMDAVLTDFGVYSGLNFGYTFRF